MWNKLLNLSKVLPNEDVISSQKWGGGEKRDHMVRDRGKKLNSQDSFQYSFYHINLTHTYACLYIYVRMSLFLLL